MLKEIDAKLDSLAINDDDLREKVSVFFKDDMASYIKTLRQIEENLIQGKAIPDEIQKKINHATYQIVERGHALESLITQKPLIEEIKNIFRKLILPWIEQSAIMRRALEKPRGYPGDCETIDYVYNNKPLSSGIGYYLDKGFLSSELCVAVRNRKEKMTELIDQFLSSKKSSKIDMLNLACGSCKEIEALSQSPFFNGPLNLTCVDHDQLALDTAQKTLQDKKEIHLTLIKEDLISVTRTGTNTLFGEKDLIYSIGLIDYLPDRVLKKLIQLCFAGLRSGGKLIVSHKDHDIYTPMKEDWLTDWKFVPRNEKRIKGLFAEAGISEANITVTRERSQIIFFLIIHKEK